MYLVGDRINLPSSSGRDTRGKIELVEEQPDGSLAYVVNTDDGEIVVRYSDDDDAISLIDDITVDFN